jgi:peptide/nickel transport system permease protein
VTEVLLHGTAGRRASLLCRLSTHPRGRAGLLIVATFAVLAALAPLISPYNPLASDWSRIRLPPNMENWFGTDELGRDILSRILWGTRSSLVAGFFSVAIGAGVGVPLGLLAGYAGGWIDKVASRFAEAMLAVPFLITASALAAFLGPSLLNAMLAIGLAAAPLFFRLARVQALAVAAEDYVASARASGATSLRVLAVHIAPNAISPLIVQIVLTTATAIVAEASLSFLGLGQQPPAPSWGSMLNASREYLEGAPWMALFPGFTIFLVILGFNLLGDSLRDELNPRRS